MLEKVCPVACPICGESQNTLPGNFDPALEPFGPVHCMVCGHAFSRTDYLVGRNKKQRQLEKIHGPSIK